MLTGSTGTAMECDVIFVEKGVDVGVEEPEGDGEVNKEIMLDVEKDSPMRKLASIDASDSSNNGRTKTPTDNTLPETLNGRPKRQAKPSEYI